MSQDPNDGHHDHSNVQPAQAVHVAHPALKGGLLALLAAVLFGISTPLVQRAGAHAGAFTTAALLYGGAALMGAWLRRPAAQEAALRRTDFKRLAWMALFGAAVGNVLRGDLGFSWRIRQPIAELVMTKLPVTLQLAGMAFVIAMCIGVPAGILSATYRNRPLDYIANLIGLAGLSTPNFWLGIMLILLVSVQLGWLPPSGYVPLTEDWRQSLATTIMPAFVLGNAIAAILMRHTRSAMLTAMSEDYVRTARAKGLPERRVVLVQAVPQSGSGGLRRVEQADACQPGPGKRRRNGAAHAAATDHQRPRAYDRLPLA